MTARIYDAGTRDAQRFCAAIDALLGYPRTHADDEPGVQRAPGAPPPYTETHARPLRHADGRLAVEIDDTIRALAGRAADVQDGSRVRVTIDATPTHEALPDGREAWTALEPRGVVEATRDSEPTDGGRTR